MLSLPRLLHTILFGWFFYFGGDICVARLSDKKNAQIVADYIECGSYRKVAKKHGISDKTVKSIVQSDSEFPQKYAHKKE